MSYSKQPVTQHTLETAIARLDLSGKAVCLHSSLRSFGHVEEGPQTIIEAFLGQGCTVLVPSFSWVFAVPPPEATRFPQNGWDYDAYPGPASGFGKVYRSDTHEIDKDMGLIVATVTTHPKRVRGYHPLCSFAAVGPLATQLVDSQTPTDVYSPLSALAELGGYVVLMGVGLERMTLLHLAEKVAGRALFRRWANGSRRKPITVAVGGCSEGFGDFEPYLTKKTERVGESLWQVFLASETLKAAAATICIQPEITHCGNPTCERCSDALKGGPILDS